MEAFEQQAAQKVTICQIKILKTVWKHKGEKTKGHKVKQRRHCCNIFERICYYMSAVR